MDKRMYGIRRKYRKLKKFSCYNNGFQVFVNKTDEKLNFNQDLISNKIRQLNDSVKFYICEKKVKTKNPVYLAVMVKADKESLLSIDEISVLYNYSDSKKICEIVPIDVIQYDKTMNMYISTLTYTPTFFNKHIQIFEC